MLGEAAARHQCLLWLLADLPLLLPPRHRRRPADGRAGRRAATRASRTSAPSATTAPRYVIELVKYARDRFGIDFIGFLDENLMTMHQSSGKTWLTEIARLWIEDGLQPQCIREGVPHDPDRCRGHPFGRHQPRHALHAEILTAMQGSRLLAPALRLRELLAPGDEDDRQGRHPGDQRAVACAGRWRPASGRSRTRCSASRTRTSTRIRDNMLGLEAARPAS